MTGYNMTYTLLSMRLSQQLKNARINAKLNQEQLAEKLNVDQSTISRIERGLAESVDTIERWLDACGCSLEAQNVGAGKTGQQLAAILSDLPPERIDDLLKIGRFLAACKDEEDRSLLLGMVDRFGRTRAGAA